MQLPILNRIYRVCFCHRGPPATRGVGATNSIELGEPKIHHLPFRRVSFLNDAVLPRLKSTGFQTGRVILALMVREMITRYGRSWGGYVWAIAQPVGIIAVLSLAFAQFLIAPPLGTSFVLFYAVGYLPFAFFQTINQTVSTAVSMNRALMRFPVVTPLDAVLARGLLQGLTMVVVNVIILFGVSLVIEYRIKVDLAGFVLACLAGGLLGLGSGALNVVLFAFFPAYRNVWAIISRPLFLVSGIFYTVESMPPHLQPILILNPLVHVSGEAHKAFYPTYDGAFVMIAYPIGLAIGLFILASALLMRHRSHIIENS